VAQAKTDLSRRSFNEDRPVAAWLKRRRTCRGVAQAKTEAVAAWLKRRRKQ